MQMCGLTGAVILSFQHDCISSCIFTGAEVTHTPKLARLHLAYHMNIKKKWESCKKYVIAPNLLIMWSVLCEFLRIAASGSVFHSISRQDISKGEASG